MKGRRGFTYNGIEPKEQEWFFLPRENPKANMTITRGIKKTFFFTPHPIKLNLQGNFFSWNFFRRKRIFLLQWGLKMIMNLCSRRFFAKEILPPPLVKQTDKLAMKFLTSSWGSKLSRLPFSFNVSLDHFPSYPQVWIDLLISPTFPLDWDLGI